MKINLDFQFKNLGGKEFDKFTKDSKGDFTKEIIENNHAAKSLALTLFYASDKNIKFKLWAEELYKTSCIDIDETDFEILTAWIDNYVTGGAVQITNPWFAQNGIKGQVTEAMKKQKEKSLKRN
jgi:hypothetical protein